MKPTCEWLLIPLLILFSVRDSDIRVVSGKMADGDKKLEALLAKSLAPLTASVKSVTDEIGAFGKRVENLQQSVEKFEGKIVEVELRSTKNTTAILKLAKGNEKDRHRIGSLTKEQFKIKQAMDRVHKLVERLRTETIQDRMEAMREQRNVVFNGLEWRVARSKFRGLRKSQDVVAFALQKCNQITNKIDESDIISAKTMPGYAKGFFRMQLELSSSHLAETVVNIGRKRGINVRQGMPKNDRDFLRSKHELAKALNEDETEGVPGKRFEVRAGSKLFLVDNETGETEQEVNVGGSKEYADCQLRLNMELYQDIADDDEENDDDDPYLSDNENEDGEIANGQGLEDARQKRASNRESREARRAAQDEGMANIRRVHEKELPQVGDEDEEGPDDEDEPQESPMGEGAAHVSEARPTARGGSGDSAVAAGGTPEEVDMDTTSANDSIQQIDPSVVKSTKRGRGEQSDEDNTEGDIHPPPKKKFTNGLPTKSSATRRQHQHQGDVVEQLRAVGAPVAGLGRGGRRNGGGRGSGGKPKLTGGNNTNIGKRLSSDLPVFVNMNPASARDKRAFKRANNKNMPVYQLSDVKQREAMKKAAQANKHLMEPLNPNAIRTPPGNGEASRD